MLLTYINVVKTSLFVLKSVRISRISHYKNQVVRDCTADVKFSHRFVMRTRTSLFNLLDLYGRSESYPKFSVNPMVFIDSWDELSMSHRMQINRVIELTRNNTKVMMISFKTQI